MGNIVLKLLVAVHGCLNHSFAGQTHPASLMHLQESHRQHAAAPPTSYHRCGPRFDCAVLCFIRASWPQVMLQGWPPERTHSRASSYHPTAGLA